VIVQCISFGTCWWFRGTKDEKTGAIVLSKSAFMNTTGFLCGGKHQWKHRSPGFIRINAGRFAFQTPSDLYQQKFVTDGITAFHGVNSARSNRLLLESRVKPDTPADAYIVTIKSDRDGTIAFKSNWRSDGVRVISSSTKLKAQEATLLMPVGSWVHTSLGKMEVECRKNLSLLALVGE
jgi:hypothetical protein